MKYKIVFLFLVLTLLSSCVSDESIDSSKMASKEISISDDTSINNKTDSSVESSTYNTVNSESTDLDTDESISSSESSTQLEKDTTQPSTVSTKNSAEAVTKNDSNKVDSKSQKDNAKKEEGKDTKPEESSNSNENEQNSNEQVLLADVSTIDTSDLSDAIIVQKNKALVYNFEFEKLTKFVELDFDIESINSAQPIFIGSKDGSVFLYDLKTEEKKEIFFWEGAELKETAWTKDGKFLIFNIYFKNEDKAVIYSYNYEEDLLSAIAMANASDYVFSADSNMLLILEKNFKKSIGKYEFKLKKCELGKEIKTLYKIEGRSGSVKFLNDYGLDSDNKAYIVLSVRDDEDVINAYVYDFKADEMQTIISFAEIYSLYMNRYDVDNVIKSVYSQLGKWVFPEIVFCEKEDSVYINDGINYYYYSKKSSNGESEIGNYNYIENVSWLDELIEKKQKKYFEKEPYKSLYKQNENALKSDTENNAKKQ